MFVNILWRIYWKKDFSENCIFIAYFLCNLQVPMDAYLSGRFFGCIFLFQKWAYKQPWVLIWVGVYSNEYITLQIQPNITRISSL